MDLHFSAKNPWEEDDDQSFRATRRLMSLARDMGYKLDTPEHAEQQQDQLESYKSVQMLKLIAEISDIEERLCSTNREISRLTLDKETNDITNLSLIESRINKLASLSSHLAEVVDKKSVITSRLQKPYSGENLLIHSTHQKHAVEFFKMISPLLSDLSNLLDTISWTSATAKDFTSNTDRVLVNSSKLYTEVKQQVEIINRLRNSLDSLSRTHT